MLQSDFRMRTQHESQVDGSSAYRNQSLPPRSTPSAVESTSMYSRAELGAYMGYQGPHLPVGISNQPSFRSTDDRGTTVPNPNRHRMSLLHPPPQSLEYSMQQITPRPDRPSPQQQPQRSGMYGHGGDGGMMKMVQIAESPPCKKLRLGDAKSDIHSPLRIDTDRGRSGPAYNPEVEAISPTLPSDTLKDESCLETLKSTKDDLLQQISRVDREIAKTESQIAKLKKKKVELEELATQPHRETEDSAPSADPVIRSLPQSLYAENRKKAMEAHQILDKLGPRVDLPLYNQPSDTAVYQENKQKFLNFKFKLQNYFRQKMKEKNRREEYLTSTYTQLSAEWGRRLDKLENNSKRRNRDAKNRETFEKIFPELRKQREDKERFSRVGSRIKSDADMEEIMDGLQEQELENKKMRSYAVIPPILLDEVSRKRRFTNRNGLIEEPMQEYKDKQLINLWTDQEKEIFKEKYLQHPKNFGIIKSYLERKSVADCVQYYYMSKKANNYRQLLRKNRARTRSSRNQQTNNSGTVNSTLTGLPVVKSEANGVTTRLQKEQKNDNPNGAVDSANQSETPMDTNNMDPETTEGNFEADDVTNTDTEVPQVPIETEFMCTNKKKRKEDVKESLNEADTSEEENVEQNAVGNLGVQEFRKIKGTDGPPILTDEEESGSTTSSCDEGEGVTHSQEQILNPLDKKDDYDSSATVSADESMDTDKHTHTQNVTIEKLKTLPNNPESPLQLTIRTAESENENNEMSKGQTQQSQVILHPISGNHSVVSINPQSHYQHQQQSQSQQQQSNYHVSTRESPGSGYQLHSASQHQNEQLNQIRQDQIHHHHHMQQSAQMRHLSPEPSETHEPMTVKDLMLATIERQLRKNPVPSQQNHSNMGQSGHPPQSLSPTIQSILKSQERGHLPQGGGQSSIMISGNSQLNIAGINHHHPNISHSSHFQTHPVYYGQKADMRAVAPQLQMIIRENMPVVHIQHANVQQPRDDYETLDLSMKKRTPSPQVSTQRPPSSGSLPPPPAHQPMDFVNRQDVYYPPKYPINRSRPPQQPQMPQMNKNSKVLPPPPLLTKPPTVSPHSSLKDGSITHGTPLQISHQQHQIPQKYEGLLKPMKEGSITHGTPLDKVRGKDQPPSPYMYERPPQDNYKRMSPAAYSFHGNHPQHVYNQKSPSGHRSPPLSTTHASTYSADQHNSSRQIIINDYYTSQQMQQPPPHIQSSHQNQSPQRMDMNKRGPPPTSVGHHGHSVYILPPRNDHPYRQSPPPPQHHQQRQGVIHRTNPSRPGIKPDPGRYQQQHDAFASLVDIAAAQPSLPVPKDDPRPRLGLPRVDVVREGLGKSMVDMERNRLNIPPHQQAQIQRGPTHQISMMQNLHDASRNRKEVEARYARDGQDATLTAASLIDAIITHQINQPSVHDRQSPIPSSRTGDRLFASFQRCVQPAGVGQHAQSHMSPSPNRPQQMERHERQLHEDMRMDDGHMMDQGNPQGGTWGDHIDLIISKDYASRKGSTMGHPPTSSSGLQKVSVPLNLPQQQYTAHPKSQDDVGPYISWKLRRALQHEKEQLQQQHQMHHPDERHIIRVVQVDQQQQQNQHSQHSRPPSTSSKESNFSYVGDASSELKEPVTSERDQNLNKNKPREGISPLDYVKNRIMEVMRTENSEDKAEDNASENSATQKLPNSACSVISSTNSSTPVTTTVTPLDSRPINHRDSAKEEKSRNELLNRPGTESPIPMVIDESGGAVNNDEIDGSNTKADTGNNSSSSKPQSNYEPLTDEEP